MSSNPPPAKPLFGVPRLHYQLDKMIAYGKIQPKPTSSQIQPKPTTSHDSEARGESTISTKQETSKQPAQAAIIQGEKKPSNENPVGKVEAMKSKNKKLKDPLAPKRPPSSFLLFSKEERSKVVEMLGSNLLGPVAEELGKRWAELDPEVKTKWEAMGKVMKAEYDEVKANYIPS